MSLINISNLTFAYDGSYDTIFNQVSFQIDTDWKLGFIGRNGRGKTTFLNLLLRNYEYSGNISANVSFEYFPYHIPDETLLTIDVIEQIHFGFEHWHLSRELNLLQVDEEVLYRPFYTLSNGERTKVLLAALFLKENCFLLIDEPTNHLDRSGRKLIAHYLKRKNGFILVSHDRTFLDACIDHVLSINKADIEVQKGNFSSWYENKQAQDQLELSQNKKLKNEIKRLSKAAKRTSEWSHKIEKTKNGTKVSGLKPDKGYIGHQAAKMMKRSIAIEDRQQSAILEKSKLLKNIEAADSLKLSLLAHHSNRLLALENIEIFYGEKSIFKDLNFQICQGDRICLNGKNGSGKSSIVKLILGDEMSYKGNLMKASNLKISYISQDTSHLHGNLSGFAKLHQIDESLFKTLLHKLGLERIQYEKDISDFSAGQKKKVLIAKSLSEQAHLYVWDEPLNYIDVLSRIQIEELLLQYQPTLLFVEHDAAFCKKIATETVQLDSHL